MAVQTTEFSQPSIFHKYTKEQLVGELTSLIKDFVAFQDAVAKIMYGSTDPRSVEQARNAFLCRRG